MAGKKISDLKKSTILSNDKIYWVTKPKTWQENIEDCILELQQQVKKLKEEIKALKTNEIQT